jgi:hypothetical protein
MVPKNGYAPKGARQTKLRASAGNGTSPTLLFRMDVSWNDLNRVQEAGDYPFRSGMITVTFAEIAIWQKNPAAKFQLMRKHPVRNRYSYVLGRQAEEKSAAAQSKLIYESSNGDLWYLSQDPATGAAAVKHLPNPQSGGQVSYTEIEKFLSESANGPEHQALRGLIGTTDRLDTMLIAYDVHPQKGEAYNELGRAIQSLGMWWHHLETVWLVRCNYTAGEIRDKLSPYIGSDDQLLVVDISGVSGQWHGINEAGSAWLDTIFNRASNCD